MGVFFLILLSTALLYGPVRKWKNNISKDDSFLSDLNADAVNKIKISYNNVETELLKQGEKWQIAGTKDFFVDDTIAQTINTQLPLLAEANFDLVSENKEKKSSFQTDESGAQVELFYDDEVISFVVGKLGSVFGTTYVSKSDNDNTYILGASISNLFNREEWPDKKIFSSDKEVINKIRFQYPNSEFTIEKKDDKWVGTLPYKFNVDNEGEVLTSVLNLMSNLSASKIPVQSFNGTGLEKHSIIVEASSDDYVNTIMIGDANEDGSYFVKRADSDNIYLISESSRNSLKLQIKDLK